MIRPWPLISSATTFDAGLFRVTRDRACSPRTGREHDFHVIHMVDWLMLVPVTTDGKIVMVRQYRHGSRENGLEVPGGLHDTAGEEPGQGALRELAEETGYCAPVDTMLFLGKLRPQPALFTNRIWIYLAQDVHPVTSPKLDAGEDMETVLIEPAEVAGLIAGGEISNAMTAVALMMAHSGGYLDSAGRPGDDQKRRMGNVCT